MKHGISVIFTLLFLFAPASALDVPYLSGHINDNARLLSAEMVSELEAMLSAYEDSTGNQIVLLTIPSLEDESLEEFSLRVAETWKLGQKGVDNGALLLIAKDDRKLRIEVGYGLEASLTDAMTSHIINSVITPRFKQGDFEAGIREGLVTIIQAADGSIGESDIASASGDDFPVAVFLLVWFGVVGLFTVLGVFTPGCAGWGLYVFLIPFYLAPAFILSELSNSLLGFALLAAYLIGIPLLRLFLPKTEFGKKMAEKMKNASSSRGGSWSSSSSSSGWSGGGGFSSGSSFSGGGGSFGGGGSSGSW